VSRTAAGVSLAEYPQAGAQIRYPLPLCLILIAAFRGEAPTGQQAVLPQCYAVDYWVKSATKVKVTDLPQSNVKSAVPNLEGCSSLIDAHAKAQASSYLQGVRFE
jgi:hypothetical protein